VFVDVVSRHVARCIDCFSLTCTSSLAKIHVIDPRSFGYRNRLLHSSNKWRNRWSHRCLVQSNNLNNEHEMSEAIISTVNQDQCR